MGPNLPFIFLLLSGFFSYGHNQERPEAVLTLEPNWSPIFTGESVTFICDMREQSETEWSYDIHEIDNNGEFVKISNQSKHTIKAEPNHSGEYQCTVDQNDDQAKIQSNIVTLSVSAVPTSTLQSDRRSVLTSNSVTLTCTVTVGTASWKIYWYRRSKTEPLAVTDQSTYTFSPSSVSESGSYMCRGGRGDPPYYTYNSKQVSITVSESPVPVLSKHPDWPQFFIGETVILKCTIQEGSASDWKYTWWKGNNPVKMSSEEPEYSLSPSQTSSGDYKCRGQRKDDQQDSKFSNTITVSIKDQPQSVLSVSPPWLSPGASVTLSCEVKESSADWRFYWYRAVPQPSHNSYTYELLPGSHTGTVEASYIIHDPTGTGGYVCKAGRGDPVYYTRNSEPQFVWSGDVHSSTSLTVSSIRTQQHFISESVSLSCEGNSTEWKVKSYTDRLNEFSPRPSKTGSTWTQTLYTSAVYWCESGPGEYSNAVNITVHTGSVILVSPVHPVTEGHSVTLQCKHTTAASLSNVDFYRNEELVQSQTNGEMIIPAVSKSDEGFYKCKYSGGESPQSWMAVRCEFTVSQPSVPAPVPVPAEQRSSPLVVGLVVGMLVVILLTIFLLLLCRYRTFKDACCVRSIESQITNQDSAADQRTIQRGHPGDGYSSLQQDASANDNEKFTDTQVTENDEPAAESSDGTDSKIELRYLGKKKTDASANNYEEITAPQVTENDESAAESSEGTDSKIELRYLGKKKTEGAGEPDVTYAQADKAKNKKEGAGEPDVTYAQDNKTKNKKAPEPENQEHLLDGK